VSATIRTAIIVSVAALAVGIGIAAGSVLLIQRTAAVGAGAAYVPGDAPFFLELRLEPSAEQDAALRELLGRFPAIEGVDLEQPLYGQLGEAIDEALAEEGAGVSWSGEVAPWFDGHVAMAITELPTELADPADPMAVPPVPPFVVLLGVRDRTAADEAIDRLLAAAGDDAPAFTEAEHLGVTIFSSESTDAGAYALTDDQLVLGQDAEVIRAALDTHAAGTGTLAEVAEMQRLTDALPDDWLSFMTYDFTDVIAAAAADAAASPEVAAAMESMLEHQSLRGAMAMSADGDRFLLDSATDPPTGPLAMTNADRGLAAEVPADALYFAEGGNIGASLAAFIGPMKDAVAATPDGEEQLAMIESALGADLEELVDWIGDGAVAIGYASGEPYAGMVLVPTDVDAAERRLGQLASFASLAALDPASGITVDETEVGGVTVTTIAWESPDTGDMMLPAPAGLVLELAVTDDRALIGLGDAFVDRVLGLDEGDSLAAVDRYRDAVAQVGGTENAGVVWLDLRGTREALESAMGPMLGLMGGGDAYESDVQPWLLPLDRVVGVTRLEGEVLIQRVALLVE
jgi:Protein of unknown function (DUF3352)